MSITPRIVHRAIMDLRRDGLYIDDLEGFLIHPDDLCSLLDESVDRGLDWTYNHLITNNMSGEVFVCGVKVVTSFHVSPGTLFRVFKTNPSTCSPYITKTNPTRQMLDLQDKIQNTVIPMPNNLLLPTVVDEKKEETKKKHSQTRKIELDW